MMRYSDIALKVLAAKECGIIKTNAQFWREFSDRERFEEEILKYDNIEKMAEKIYSELVSFDYEGGFVCIYDDEFPLINRKVKNNSEKPYLLFYKGDLSLLEDLNKNVAVIGLLDPDKEIIKRESEIVRQLVEKKLVIVSGLAAGCDTIAHKTCLDNSGKTVAILPTQINKVYPAENRIFAEEIVNNGGLLLSEYYKEPTNRHEAISRFIERDRLQAMFAKAIILIASYRKGEGDSGSRHAMESARKYGIERYVMYNYKIDENNERFGLNKDLAYSKCVDKVKVLQTDSIGHIKSIKNLDLVRDPDLLDHNQLTFL